MAGFGSIELDGCGFIWIEPVTRPRVVIQQLASQPRHPPKERNWEIYNARGKLVGTATLPLLNVILYIDKSTLLAGVSDEYDVLELGLYDIERPDLPCDQLGSGTSAPDPPAAGF